jgi:hypothetical protein
MKNILMAFCILISASCNQKNSSQQNSFIPNKKLENVVDSFLSVNKCEGQIHEIYIDKLDPHNFQIILHQGKISLTKEENADYHQKPLFTSTIQGIDFKVYSGAEHYFNNSDNDSLELQERKLSNTFSNDSTNGLQCEKLWLIKDSFGVLTIRPYKNGAYPFMPPPIWPDTIPPIKNKLN